MNLPGMDNVNSNNVQISSINSSSSSSLNINNTNQNLEFVCQNPHCRRPLDLDFSLLELDPETLKQDLSLEELESKREDWKQRKKLNLAKPSIGGGGGESFSNKKNQQLQNSQQKSNASPSFPHNNVVTASSIALTGLFPPFSNTLINSAVGLPQQDENPSNNQNNNNLQNPNNTQQQQQQNPLQNSNNLLRESISVGGANSGWDDENRRKLLQIFHVVSTVSDMDHPLCSDCSQRLSQILQSKTIETDNESDFYQIFYNATPSSHSLQPQTTTATPHPNTLPNVIYPPPTVVTLDHIFQNLDKESKSLESEEQTLIQRLKQIETQRRLLKQELNHLQNEEKRATYIESKYWEEMAAYESDLQEYQLERESVTVNLVNAQKQLERLQVSNVFNDCFHIWFDGHFGTINSFRLGRLPSQPVDWNEINAAWGFAVLALQSIAKHVNYNFKQYRLLAQGSASKIERIADNTQYELFGSSDISLGRLFWYRRFDNAMVAFLHCIKEFGEFAEQQDKSFKLPYRIDKDKIAEVSIKIQVYSEETWTKALKFMLTDLKFLIVFVSRFGVLNKGSLTTSTTSTTSSTTNSLPSSPSKMEVQLSDNTKRVSQNGTKKTSQH